MSNWIPSDLKHGRVINYINRKYGSVAFNNNGDLKISYLRMAIKETNNESLKKALRLAIEFEKNEKVDFKC